MNRALWVAMLIALPGVHGAVRAQESSASVRDPRIREVEYRDDAVVPVTAVVGDHLHLEFGRDERFVNLAAGNTALLDAGAEGPNLFLKVLGPMPRSNVTIVTTRHVYVLELEAVRVAPGPRVYSLRFRYPDAPAAVAQVTMAPPRPRNLDYAYCGDRALKPVAAWDDGLQTHLRFAPATEWPVVSVDGPDGESIVNTHVEEDVLVVQRLAARLVLRRGRQVGCVTNGLFRGGSFPEAVVRAASGTVDAAVERTVRGRAP